MRRRARRLRLRRGVIIAAMLAGACLLGGCSRQSILTTHSPQSHNIMLLWWWMLAAAAIVFFGAVLLRLEPTNPVSAKPGPAHRTAENESRSRRESCFSPLSLSRQAHGPGIRQPVGTINTLHFARCEMSFGTEPSIRRAPVMPRLPTTII